MSDRRRNRTVRPGWVWSGLLTAIAGTVVIGVGVILLSWTWSLIGTGVLLAGAGISLAGGVMYDVHSTSPAVEISQVVDGDVHEGVAPGETRSTPESRQRAHELDRRLDTLERAVMQAPRPVPDGPAAVTMLLVAVFLLVCQWALYPTGLPGQTNANRALGCAIVLGLCGLRVLTSQPRQRHLVAGSLAGLASLTLLVNGLLAPHDRTVVAVAEGVCGALSVVSSAILLSRQPTPPPAQDLAADAERRRDHAPPHAHERNP